MTQLSMSITRRSLRLGRLAKTFAASPACPAGGLARDDAASTTNLCRRMPLRSPNTTSNNKRH